MLYSNHDNYTFNLSFYEWSAVCLRCVNFLATQSDERAFLFAKLCQHKNDRCFHLIPFLTYKMRKEL